MIETWTDEPTGKTLCRDFECPDYLTCLTRLAKENAHRFHCLKDCPNIAIIPKKTISRSKALPKPIKEVEMPKKGKRKDAIPSTSEIVARIFQQLAEIKMKPGQLIKKAAISSSTYHRIIHHERMGKEVWQNVANVLGVTTRWLLEGSKIDMITEPDNLALPYPNGLVTTGIAESQKVIKNKPDTFSPLTVRKTLDIYEFENDLRRAEVGIDQKGPVTCKLGPPRDKFTPWYELNDTDLAFLALVLQEIKSLLAQRNI